MTRTPALTGQDIGAAEAATRAVLERTLARTGTGFHGWVALNVLNASGAALGQDELAGRLTDGLKIGELASQGLVSLVPAAAACPRVMLTEPGTARYRQIREDIGQIAEHLYHGLPADDLATAHRVLSTVTQRANAVLAQPDRLPAG